MTKNRIQLLFLLFFIAYTHLGRADYGVGRVDFISTLQGNPALNPNVVWLIKRYDAHLKQYNILYSFQRHTLSLNLLPGQYRAIAQLNGKSIQQDFYLQATQERHIELALD